MYIRQIARRLADGSRVRYLQLAHKVRDPETGVPRDEVLHHFGREDEIDRAQIQRLIDSLARFLEPGDHAAVRHAGNGALPAVERSLAYGGSYILDAVWRRLELDSVLKALLRERAYQSDLERLLFALVANRALAPGSKLSLERWVGKRAAIDGIEDVSVHQLYRAMDFLVGAGEEIQRQVFFSTATLLNLEVDLLFFDTTMTHFQIEESDAEGEGLRRYGRPKKNTRADLPQVVIGLAVTRGGIPVRCWSWPGNTNDASVVEQVQEDLAGWKLSRVVWVMDRGMAGRDQRIALQRGGGHVIMGEKLRGGQPDNEAALSRPGRYQTVRENLRVKEVSVQHGSEVRRFVIVYNPQQAERDRAQRAALTLEAERQIEALNKRRRNARRAQAVSTLKSHPAYGRYVRELKSGALRLDRSAIRAEERLDGKYLLSTTDPSLSAEDVALGYKQLQDVERGFRTLKHTLDLRPIFHRLPERITAHVLLCWLALLLVRVIERETGQTWDRMREELDRIHRVDLCAKDGAFQVTTRLTAQQRKLFKDLDIAPPKQVQTAAATAETA